MDSFAFIIHPLDPKRDVARKYPFLGHVLPAPAIHFLSRFWPPVQLSHVTGIRSQATGKEIEGWLIAVPYTAQRMLHLPVKEVYRKIIAAGRLAERLGAQILGLGAYTSVVGDGGATIARNLNIAVSSGDSYTAAISVRATRMAAGKMGIDLAATEVAVVGASGAIGAAVVRMLARDVPHISLIARERERLIPLAEEIKAAGCEDVLISTDVTDIRSAGVVVTVTSAGGNLIQPEMLRRGAVVCDVSRPRDVSLKVAQARDDVLVIDGGLVRVPGEVAFGFDYGLPPDLTYGCFAEIMTLALEGRFENYSIGKHLPLEKIQRIDALAAKHGFELAALRSFEHKLDESLIQQIKARAASNTYVS